MIKTSTGLRNAVLGTSSLATALSGGKIRIFSGAQPDTADHAETGTLLCEISVNDTGTGLSFESPAGGMMVKDAGETWSGTNLATGVATWYRHVGSADSGALSTSEPRIQGRMDVVGADLNLSSVSLTMGAIQTIDYYVIVWPTM
jgi:hypothetical protein